MTFRQELIALLKRIGVTYDPRYSPRLGANVALALSPLTGLWPQHWAR